LTDHCGYEVAVQIVLDSRLQGHYHDDHNQFDTIRRLRSAFHSQAACSAMNSGSNLALGNERGEYQRFAREPTASDLVPTVHDRMQAAYGSGLETKYGNQQFLVA
jgi:hypothetical protein